MDCHAMDTLEEEQGEAEYRNIPVLKICVRLRKEVVCREDLVVSSPSVQL